jgi:hypothetical protein
MKNPNSAFLTKSLIRLRTIWFVLLVLLVASFAGNVIAFPKSFLLHKGHCYVFIFRILVFCILIFATYKKTKPWWFFTIAVVSLKTIALLNFYTDSYYIRSVLYYEEYASIFFRLKLPTLGLLLFGNNLVSAAILLSTYGYCLYLCELLVQASTSTTNALQPPAPAPSDSAKP